MADRVKYLLLGLLFLVVAGVIAYDRWNPQGDELTETRRDEDDTRARIVIEDSLEDPVDQERRNARPVPPAPDGGRTRERNLDLDPTPSPTPPAPRPEPVRPAPRPEPEPAPRPEPTRARTHVVQSGETLEKIALDYYGTRRGMAWIVEANELSNPDRIFAKQQLVIPARSESGTTRRPVAVREEPTRTIPSTYVVEAGEDLYGICRRFYGTQGLPARVNEVMELNGLWSKNVAEGARLQLPSR